MPVVWTHRPATPLPGPCQTLRHEQYPYGVRRRAEVKGLVSVDVHGNLLARSQHTEHNTEQQAVTADIGNGNGLHQEKKRGRVPNPSGSRSRCASCRKTTPISGTRRTAGPIDTQIDQAEHRERHRNTDQECRNKAVALTAFNRSLCAVPVWMPETKCTRYGFHSFKISFRSSG